MESAVLGGKTVLVAGASGGVGEGVTLALLRAGARVVAAGRDMSRLQRLAKYVRSVDTGELILQNVDVSHPDSEGVRQAILDRSGGLDGAIISIASWGPPGPKSLMDMSNETWAEMIEDNVTSHFRAIRSLTPLVTLTGAIVNLSGYSAEIPFPSAPLVGASNAAQKSLMRSLAAELGERGPRVYQLILGAIRTRPRAAMGADNPGWFSATQVGEHIAGLVAGSSEFAGHVVQYLLDRKTGVQVSNAAVSISASAGIPR